MRENLENMKKKSPDITTVKNVYFLPVFPMMVFFIVLLTKVESQFCSMVCVYAFNQEVFL